MAVLPREKYSDFVSAQARAVFVWEAVTSCD